jgi:hypothetical protein
MTAFVRFSDAIQRWFSAGHAYTELMRIAGRTTLTEEAALRFDSKLKRFLRDTRVVLGVETQLFWGSTSAAMSEFFVAISRARNELALTHVDFRERPAGPVRVWDEERTAHQGFIDFAHED